MTRDTEDWYASEPPTRRVLISELQRIKRRTLNRPLPVIALAALLTFAIVRKIASKPVVLTAEVVLALTEGSLSSHGTGIPYEQLSAYVNSVLLPDNKLIELIEKFNLSRLRAKLGPQFAIEELRSNFTIEIWKNSFVYIAEEDENARRSARIGISVTDTDPDRAYDIARELATIIMDTATVRRQQLAEVISKQAAMVLDATNETLADLATQISDKQAAIEQADKRGRPDIAGVLRIDLQALELQQQRSEADLGRVATSLDSIASEVAAAGLDMSLAIVDERRPDRPTPSGFALVLVGVVVGTATLIAVALALGAFDSRVHDPDDVRRLGLPVLGHVPGFAGDRVGSMRARSAVRARIPFLQRWRSHR